MEIENGSAHTLSRGSWVLLSSRQQVQGWRRQGYSGTMKEEERPQAARLVGFDGQA